jgi:signal transduction histidine kinase
MVAILFFYGLVFVVAGALLAFQARLPRAVLSRRALAYLAAFALLHGTFEWGKMLLLAPPPGLEVSKLVEYALLAASFSMLVQFALEVFVSLSLAPAWSKLVPPALFVIALAAGLAPSADPEMRVHEALVRYGFGFVGSSLASGALVAVGRDRRRHGYDHDRVGRFLSVAAGVLAVYGLLSGLLVPRAPFAPASWLNAESFSEATGLRIEVLRAACGLLVAALLSEVFVVESAREHVEWERLREEFISVVAHDLRSPIGAISLGAETLGKLLDRGASLDPAKARKVVEHMKSSTKNLDRMVADLLDTTRIEARSLVLRTQPVELEPLVRGIVDRARPATEGHPLEVVLADSLPSLTLDPARVEQVLGNLLSNAAKYSAPGSEIRLRVSAHETQVEVSVTNEGNGLSAAEQEKLFTRFYRAPSQRERAEGLGLGLYIAKGLVEAHGGRLWVATEQGATTFAFTLPVDQGTSPRA